MQIGIVGLGRMGANMARRLMDAGHRCVVYDRQTAAVEALAASGAQATGTLVELVARLDAPRIVWLMLPAAVVDETLAALRSLLQAGDLVVDGGNSNFRDDRRRADALAAQGLHFVDVGTSGGVWGRQNGYCLMVGGESASVARLEAVFDALTAATDGATRGWLHCGASGAGHFVKMVHNGIEYGLMAAYAEGFEILSRAGSGAQARSADAETAPFAQAELYRYEFDVAQIAALWRQGSVVRSWLLDLLTEALQADPALGELSPRMADSGEGRWTLQAAIDLGAPTPVLASALLARFASQGQGEFAGRIVSAMRRGFGGHAAPAAG
jgi:6-phosphogluconate dehydrogenase